MEMKIKQFSEKKYFCEVCDYTTSRKGNFDTHLNSGRHTKIAELEINGNKIKQNSAKFSKTNYACEMCNKIYCSASGLWKHTQKCPSKANPITDKDELIKFLIKENSEFKSMMMEQQGALMEQQGMMIKMLENGTHNTTISNTNSHNKAFNLNFFLNETCKNAMNMSEFIDSIKLQVSDLERIGELGYVEGISSIITSNLRALDITKRPIHCTDKKRETIYVKDENQWNKEDDNKTLIRNAIKKVSNKNIRLLPQFKEKYPEYNNSYSNQSDLYDKMIIEVMSTEAEKEDKIIRNIAKNIVIDKT